MPDANDQISYAIEQLRDTILVLLSVTPTPTHSVARLQQIIFDLEEAQNNGKFD